MDRFVAIAPRDDGMELGCFVASPPPARHCERSEAVHLPPRRELDCFAAIAARNDGCTLLPQRKIASQACRERESAGFCHFPSASAISPSVPTMTRHQANRAKPWCCT